MKRNILLTGVVLALAASAHADPFRFMGFGATKTDIAKCRDEAKTINDAARDAGVGSLTANGVIVPNNEPDCRGEAIQFCYNSPDNCGVDIQSDAHIGRQTLPCNGCGVENCQTAIDQYKKNGIILESSVNRGACSVDILTLDENP